MTAGAAALGALCAHEAQHADCVRADTVRVHCMRQKHRHAAVLTLDDDAVVKTNRSMIV